MSEKIPKLHGWITPEYAAQMIKDLLKYLLTVDGGTYLFNNLNNFIDIGRYLQVNKKS